MQRTITKIKSVEITTYGHEYTVAGVWDNKPFLITLYCEYDGRDVDSDTPRGGYNPMTDYESPAPMFFDVLCGDERFAKLHNEGYAVFEKLPHEDDAS